MGTFNNNYNTNLDTTITPNFYNPQYPPINKNEQLMHANPNKPYEVKDNYGNILGYFWYYGNSVDLVWDIIGEFIFSETDTYLGVADVVSQNIITATIYDWRGHIIESRILTPDIDGESVSVSFKIFGELSNKLVKGTYTISLTISDENQEYNETLFNAGICKFEVR